MTNTVHTSNFYVKLLNTYPTIAVKQIEFKKRFRYSVSRYFGLKLDDNMIKQHKNAPSRRNL